MKENKLLALSGKKGVVYAKRCPLREKKRFYLDALRKEVKTKLKGDPILSITQDDVLDLSIKLYLGRSTIERFFGIDKSNPNCFPSQPTCDKLSSYLGFSSYNDFVKKVIALQDSKDAGVYPPSSITSQKKSITEQHMQSLVSSANLLAFRLKEILSGKGTLLLRKGRQDEQSRYWYISTLYRFASLLAWINIVRKDAIYLGLGTDCSSVYEGITSLQKVLSGEVAMEESNCEGLLYQEQKQAEVALFYFDWQIAIGELMVGKYQQVTSDIDLMGFDTFEMNCQLGTERFKRWLLRMERLFLDLPICSEESTTDKRMRHLQEIYTALRLLQGQLTVGTS